MKKIAYIFILLMGLSSCLQDEDLITPENPDIAESPIVINEVYTTGDPDWVEFYNTSDEDVNLIGYEISDGIEPKYTIASDQIVPGKGYLVLPIEKDIMGFSLSSQGESFSIWNTNGELIDQIDFPALEEGLSYGRETDGADTWVIMVATREEPNSNVNNSPMITADTILSMNDNAGYRYQVKVTDESGVRSVKVFYENKTTGTIKFEDMAPIGGGDYIFQFPAFNEDDEIEYYVEAVDETGLKSYFPEDAPDEKLSVVVENGYPIISNFYISTENPAENEAVTIKIDVYDVTGIDDGDVNLYYVLNDDIADNKIKLDMVSTDGKTYSVDIPGQAEGTTVRYYLRAKDASGNKTYYPVEGDDFDHDVVSTWPTYVASPPEPLNQLVINELCTKDDIDPYYTDPAGDGSDWVELYNGTDAEIDIAGYWFSDKGENADDADKYQVPTGSDITKIPAGGYLVIIFGAADADGNDMEGIIDGKIFIPTGLSTSKDEAVAMWAADKTTLVDVSEKFNADGPFGELEDEKSLGRTFDASPKWKVWDVPTPDAINE